MLQQEQHVQVVVSETCPTEQLSSKISEKYC